MQETQLSVLGVASLPDNPALKKKENEDDREAVGDEVAEEESFPPAPPCSLGPGLTEQLQMSFSKLREAEVGYRAGMEGLAEQIEQVRTTAGQRRRRRRVTQGWSAAGFRCKQTYTPLCLTSI